MPGSGKTTLATALAEALDFSLVSKDYIKEVLFDALAGPAGDLEFSRRIGGAAMEVLWVVATHSPDVILEANFRPHSAHERKKIEGLDANVVELFCECPREEAARRFASRAKRGVHPAHPLTELSSSLMDEYDGPVGIGRVIRVNTAAPIDLRSVVSQVHEAFARRSAWPGRSKTIDARVVDRQIEASSSGAGIGVEYRTGRTAVTVPAFLELARRVWQRDFDAGRTAAAIALTENVGAWTGGQLVGAVRVLSDGYFFSTIPEVMVHPDYRRQGIGRELMHRALALAPGGRVFFGAQSGNEGFFERIGFVRGPTGFVGRLEKLESRDR
jgi:GNAT superfamily N-acetyltransferase/predicted kinase